MPPDSPRPVRRWLPSHTAAAVFSVVLAALLAAYLHGARDVRFGWTVPLVPAFAAGAAAALQRRRWYAWLDGFLLGVFSGTIAVIDLLRRPAFDEAYFVSMMTMVFFLALFFFIGAIAETVRWLHRLLHRRPAKPEL